MKSLPQNAIQRIFHRSRVLLPVIHPVSRPTALASIQIAADAGADGIFLINQGMSTDQVLAFIPEVAWQFAGLWIGVNLLGVPPEDVIERILQLPVGGIWSDNAGIDECGAEQPAGLRFRKARERWGWGGLYFGGVAFKYQMPVSDKLLPDAARKASPWVDVITTSGPGTGIPAPVTKVQALRSGAVAHPMALASGISPENIAGYLPYVDAYLAATEIETWKGSGVLVPERTQALANAIHYFV